MKKTIEEFKAFALRGNVIDMAVGVIVGGAFGKIVSSLVGDVVMPVIGVLTGGVNFTDLNYVIREAVKEGDKIVKPEVVLSYGKFIQTSVDFLIIAIAIFVAIKLFTKAFKKEEPPAEEPAPAPTPEDIVLLTEIRDLLKANAQKNQQQKPSDQA